MRATHLLALAALSSAVVSWAAPTVRLVTSLPSPQPVGTVIGLSAMPKDEGEPEKLFGKFRYRFSVSTAGAPFRVLRDFSPQADFSWRPELYEHEARLQVTVRNIATKLTGEAELVFRV